LALGVLHAGDHVLAPELVGAAHRFVRSNRLVETAKSLGRAGREAEVPFLRPREAHGRQGRVERRRAER
jgi:hypothetical protein